MNGFTTKKMERIRYIKFNVEVTLSTDTVERSFRQAADRILLARQFYDSVH